MKQRYTFTLTPELQIWAKDYFKKEGKTFSAWVEIELVRFSCSIHQIEATGSK